MIKQRPRIRLRLPADVRLGEVIPAEVELTMPRPVDIDWLDLSMIGKERTVFGSGKSRAVYDHTLIHKRARLSGPAQLPSGRRTFECRIPLDADLPPTNQEQHHRVSVHYTVEVRASIPWWPDARQKYTVAVCRPWRELPDPQPLLIATRAGGPAATEPFLEVALDTTDFCPGDYVDGRAALYNCSYNDYKAVEVSLVSGHLKRRRPGDRATALDGRKWTLRVPVEELHEGIGVPFRMRLPAGLVSTSEGKITAQRWFLDVRAKTGLLRPDAHIRIPVVIHPPPPAGHAPSRRRLAPPAIGSDRAQEVWRRVAQSVGMSHGPEGLRAERGDVSVRVRREHRGPKGIFLVAELAYPPLHLALDGGLASGFQRVLGGGVGLGDPDWDRRHYLAGREPAQVRAFGRALLPALTHVTLADVTDERMVLQRADAGLRAAPLRELAGSAVALADLMPAARAAIPPPAALAEGLAAWASLAGRLDGELERARMAVVGTWEGAAVEVFTDWTPEREVLRTAVLLRSGRRFDDEHHARWAGGELVAGDPSRFASDAREVFDALCRGALSVEIHPHALELSLPGLVVDPSRRVPRRLGQLARLAALLHGATGPYR